MEEFDFETIPVRIHLHSHIINLTMADLEEETVQNMLEQVLPTLSEEEQEAMTDEIDYTTDGVLVNGDDYVEISYEESENMGLAGVKTSLVWYKNAPDVVTMVRTGEINAAFVFHGKKKRQMCTYNTGVMPLELCVCTRRIDNSIDCVNACGHMDIDYIIEFRGMNTERNLLSVTVERKQEEVPDMVSRDEKSEMKQAMRQARATVEETERIMKDLRQKLEQTLGITVEEE